MLHVPEDPTLVDRFHKTAMAACIARNATSLFAQMNADSSFKLTLLTDIWFDGGQLKRKQ